MATLRSPWLPLSPWQTKACYHGNQIVLHSNHENWNQKWKYEVSRSAKMRNPCLKDWYKHYECLNILDWCLFLLNIRIQSVEQWNCFPALLSGWSRAGGPPPHSHNDLSLRALPRTLSPRFSTSYCLKDLSSWISGISPQVSKQLWTFLRPSKMHSLPILKIFLKSIKLILKNLQKYFTFLPKHLQPGTIFDLYQHDFSISVATQEQIQSVSYFTRQHFFLPTTEGQVI